MEDKLQESIKYIIEYCHKHGVFAYNDYMERSFNYSLTEVVKFHKEQHVVKK
jgi:hypothetical protein